MNDDNQVRVDIVSDVSTLKQSGTEGGAVLDALRSKTDALTQSAQQQAAAVRATQKAWFENSAGIKASGDQYAVASDQVQKLLNKYDPLGAKLRALQADFAVLRKAMGDSSSDEAARAFSLLEHEIQATTAQTKNLNGVWKQTMHGIVDVGNAVEHAHGQMASGAEKTMFATAGAKRELIVLAHEAMTGNFSRMPGSFMVLAERMSITEALLSPMTLGIVGVGVAAVGMALAIAKGHEEMVAMNNAIATTGNFAGVTRGTMRALADEMTQTGSITIGTAKDIVTALVASGRIGSESIAGLSQLAGDFAAATGRDIAQIAPELVKLFADPAKGAEELNKSMHFLNATELEYIDHLVRVGEVGEAQRVLMEKTTAAIPKQIENVGYLGHQWDLLKQSISAAVDAMGAWGATATVNEQLRQAKALIEREGGNVSDAARGVAPNFGSKDMREAYALVAALQKQADAEKAKADEAGKAAVALEKQNAAAKDIEKSATHQIAVLKEQRDTMLANSKASEDRNRREYEYNKQIADLQRSIGAEGRKLTEDEITLQATLSEITLKSAADDIVTQQKLGAINAEERDRALLFNALELNVTKQLHEEQMANMRGLSAAEKHRHEIRLQQLQAEGAATFRAYQNKLLVDEKNLRDEILKNVNATGATEISALEKAIAAQIRHNAEIGKTAEQKALERQAIEEAGIAQMEIDAAEFENAAKMEGIDLVWREALAARAALLRQEIILRRQLAGVMGDTAVLEANEAATRKITETWTGFTKDLSRSLSSEIMRGGQSGGELLERYFETLVLTPSIEFLMSPFTNAAGGALGANVAGGASGTLLGTVLGNLAAKGDGVFAQFAGGVSGAMSSGIVSGFQAGMSIIGLEGGAAAGLGLMLPGIGAGLAAFSLAKSLFGNDEGYAYTTGYQSYGNITGAGYRGTSLALAQNPGGAKFADVVPDGGIAADIAFFNDLKTSIVAALTTAGTATGFNPASTIANLNVPVNLSYAAGATAADIAAARTQAGITAVNAALDQFAKSLGMTQADLQKIIDANTSKRSLLESLMTDAEKLAAAQTALANAGIPATAEGFRAMANSIDPATAAGQAMLATMIGLKPAFDLVQQSAASVTTATEETVTALRSAADILSERNALQSEYDNLTMSQAQLLEKQRNALDASNQSLFDSIQLIKSANAEQDKANQIKAAREATLAGSTDQFMSWQDQLAVATGQKTQLQIDREKTLGGALSETTFNIMKQVFALQDLKTASDAAAATARQLADAAAATARQMADAWRQAQDTAHAQAQQDYDKALSGLSGAENALLSAYQREADIKRQLVGTWRQYSASLMDFNRSLAAGALSPLSPTQKYAAAAAQLDDLERRARLGDTKAIEQLQSIEQAFLESSQVVNASNEQFTRDFLRVQSINESVASLADRQADIAQQQLDDLTRQVSLLISIDSGVTSVASAINALAAAQGAVGTASTNLTNTPASSATIAANNTAAVLSLYAGNATASRYNPNGPDASAIAYWERQIATKGLATVQTDFAWTVNDYARNHPLDGSHAGGLEYVPFDGYRAELHRGERVQTAAQVRSDTEIAKEIQLLRTEVTRLTAIVDKQTGAITGAVDNAAGANSADLRGLKQHLAHVVSRKVA
ncbi:MAG: phage tail length tape measure family protein [Betaproteobacteria bacterium]|nr:phage tail length tape measure family protein [Betaproteobacteria bacterium]